MDMQALSQETSPAPVSSTAPDAVHDATVPFILADDDAEDVLASPEEFAARLARLSQTELTVLNLMTRGLLNKQIAFRCGTAQSTIKSHVTQILRKLKTHSRTTAAVRYAIHRERLRTARRATHPA